MKEFSSPSFFSVFVLSYAVFVNEQIYFISGTIVFIVSPIKTYVGKI